MLLYRRCSILCRSCFCRPFSSVTSFDTDGDTKRRRGRNVSSSSDDDDEPRTVETTDRTNENVSSPRPEDTKDTRDDVCLDNDDAWSVRRSAMNMNGWRRSCFFCRLVLLLVVKFVPKLFSVCSVLFSLCPKNVKIVNTQKSSSQNFSSKNAHELSKGHKKQRGRRFFTSTYEKPIIYNQSSSLVCAPFLHRLYLFIGCERERERESGAEIASR